jgi:hypothetical protein
MLNDRRTAVAFPRSIPVGHAFPAAVADDSGHAITDA